jgi:HSP20 family protein
MFSFSEPEDLAADIGRLFEELDRCAGRDAHHSGAVHTPPLDVLENTASIEVFVDLPGVEARALRVVFKHGTLLIAGEKVPAEGACQDGSAFHLVERSFGRFARVVRFETAVDARRGRASLADGVLRITLPRIAERRGREIVVPVDATA